MADQSYDPRKDFEKQYKDKVTHQKRPTILVAGYTGCGKTRLIQAICGRDVVPDSHIGDGLPQTRDYYFYQNEFIRFWDSRGLEVGDTEAGFVERTRNFVRKLQEDSNVDNHVHLVWYTVQGPGARVTPCDLKLIKEIFPNVVVLITKSDITKPKQLTAMTEALVNAGVSPARVLPCSETDEASLKQVVNLSHDLLPAAYRDAFVSAQLIDLDTKRFRAQAAIHSAAAAVAAAGAVPIPFADAALITPIQVGLIASLAIIYGEPAEGLKAALAPILVQEMGIFCVSGLTKWIPGLGSMIQAGVAFSLTEALGQVVNQYLLARARARLEGRVPPEFAFDWQMFVDAFNRAKRGAETPKQV